MLLTNLVNILLEFSSQIGYAGVVLLMTIESSFVPFPSEIVVPPAAYLAAQGEFNVYLVILSGIVGSLLGALINYFLARTLGRKIVYSLINKKFTKYLLLSESKLTRAEEYFRKYGAISTFIGRLIPAIRQLISIPAGFSKMKMNRFLFFTFLGSGLWTIILAVLGYTFGANQEAILAYYNEFKHLVYSLIVIVVLVIVFFWIRSICNNKRYKDTRNKETNKLKDTN